MCIHKQKKRIVSVFLSVLFLLLTPVTGLAQTDEEMLSMLEMQVSGFLTEVYQMSDEQLANLGSNGGVYQILTNAWEEDREIVGAFRALHEVTAEESGKELTVTSVVEFERYTSDVVMYFDTETYAPKNYVMNIRYSLKEKMQQAAQNMAVGLIVVFGILLFLMLIIYLFRFLPSATGAGRKKKEPAEKTAAVMERPAVAPVSSGDASEEELAAVIAAAIAAASEESPGSASGYTVRTIRRSTHRSRRHA